jgi:hypothetical protein
VLVMADELGTAVHRSIVLVDVEGFSARHRTRADQSTVRHGLYRALELAFTRSRMCWDDCYREDRGDGVLILVQPQVPKAVLAAGVPGELAAAIRAHNQMHGPAARMRLRLALHAGEVLHDAHGVTGTAVNFTFRLLEADPLKQALAGSPGVLAAVCSAWFYEEVIRHAEECAPATWRRVHVTVKETHEDGWISLPDAPYPARLDAALPTAPSSGAEVRYSPPDAAGPPSSLPEPGVTTTSGTPRPRRPARRPGTARTLGFRRRWVLPAGVLAVIGAVAAACVVLVPFVLASGSNMCSGDLCIRTNRVTVSNCTAVIAAWAATSAFFGHFEIRPSIGGHQNSTPDKLWAAGGASYKFRVQLGGNGIGIQETAWRYNNPGYTAIGQVNSTIDAPKC